MKAEESQMVIAQDISSINGQKQQQFPLKKIAHHWHLYVSHHAPSILDINKTLHKLVYICYNLCKKQYFESLFDINEIPQQFYEININYSKILTTISSYAKLQDDIARIIHQLLQNFGYEPTTFLQALSIILHYYLENILNKKNKMVIVMVTSFPISDINQIRAHMVDNFVSLEVVVLKVYSIKLMPVSFQFVCFDCKGVFTHLLENGNYSIPIRCLSSIKKHCSGRLFTAKKQSVTTIFMQRIKVQEQDPQGRVPRQIVCQLRNNLVSKLITGQTIKLSGIIKTQSIDEKDKKTHGIFTPYIIVNSLQQKISGAQKHYDMQCIHKMQQNKNIFYSIIKSFCPTIYGHDIVKAGIVLGIVGGSNKYLNDESIFRQTSHVLLLGDPGIGKSQMLKFAVQMLSHSIYVNATGVSHSGLTVTINKQNNQQSLEAGALILADNGICAIDEFDKATDLSSLLEVMEQQTVSIAKAGIICQLKCRVGIIASANPIHGCYNSTKSFRQNTKISNAILSRFDLIFLLVDKPDPARDKKLSQHIMKIHNQKRKKHYQQKYEEIESRQGVTSQYANYLSLNDKYSKIVESVQTVYNIEELKKYMNYVRNQIHPMLTIQASQIIKGFYIALRQNNPDNSFQITNRQLQSLVRLAMARARLECRNKVTQNDALEITQLMQESLFDSFEQMGYNINALRNQSKKAKILKKNGELSMPKQRNLYIDALQEQTNIRSSTIWQWTELVQLAKQLELNIGDFYNFIERLNQDGILLQKGNKRYSLQKVYL